jgi:hypothetical protein
VSDDHENDELLPDIEIGRYALRTFNVYHGGKLRSLYNPVYWEGGTMIAECRKNGWDAIIHLPGVPSPVEGCSCGLYGTLTFEQLAKEYPEYASIGFAVIAAEGTTFVGTKGLRTAAARIVAYWLPDPTETFSYAAGLAREAFGKLGEDVTRYTTIREMLAAYNFPQPEEEPEEMLIKAVGASTGTLWGRLWSSGQATSQPVRGSGVGYTFTVSPTSGLVYQVTSAVDDVVDAVPGLKTAAKGVEKAKEAVDKAKEAKIEWMKQLAKAWGIPFTILGGLL